MKVLNNLYLILLLLCPVVVFSQAKIQLPERGLCAHRGAMDTHPENTLPAFSEAIKLGAHMIEFDIQLTKDGKLVIMHDATVDRTTNGTGKVAELSFSEIRKLDAGVKKGEIFKGTQVPTFEETLALMPKNIWLNCHLKGGKEVGVAAAKALKKSGRQNQSFLACGEEAAEAARLAVPSVMICNSENKYRTQTEKYVAATLAMKAPFIQLLPPPAGEDRLSQLKLLKENKVIVNYYYAKTPEELPGLFNSGVNFVLVNNLKEMFASAVRMGIQPVNQKN
ncbi:MAG: glycerophosphodiester phosphodiesterase [Pyrinomonadaceae bacterium]|nr:glycerophosphodiester phosphodiesterase [Sphingobacteriaceae bacterium]